MTLFLFTAEVTSLIRYKFCRVLGYTVEVELVLFCQVRFFVATLLAIVFAWLN